MQVKIGPSYFRNEIREYSDWIWSYGRESAQNSIDCNSQHVNFQIALDGANTRVVFENDGDVMTREIIVDKLLALGESGKIGNTATVGAFGKAKIILYMAQESYIIHSGQYLVVGRGGDYELTETDSLAGTRSEVLIPGNHVDRLIAAVRKFASCCNWRGVLTLNGEVLQTRNKPGYKRREFGWATVYTNKSYANRLIVRVKGIPMFTRYISLDRTVIVELEKASTDILASNRDGLQWRYQDMLDSFVTELTVNKASALQNQEPVYVHFRGEKLKLKSEVQMEKVIAAAYATVPQATSADVEVAVAEGRRQGVDVVPQYDESGRSAPVRQEAEMSEAVPAKKVVGHGRISHEFIIRNCLGMRIPDHFLPGMFSSYSLRLVGLWVKCLVELHRVLGRTDNFAVGFSFDVENEAYHEKSAEYGRIYFIAPAVVVEQRASKSRSLKKRWKFNPAGKYAILSRALHEFVHAECSSHDETYSSRLTELTGVAFAKIGELRKALG